MTEYHRIRLGSANVYLIRGRALIITVGLNVIPGRDPEVHETLLLLGLGWLGMWLAAKKIMVGIGGKPPN